MVRKNGNNIVITEIKDKIIWNEFLIKVCPKAFFQSWEWGEAEEQERHIIKRWGVFNKGDLTGIAQVIKIYAKRGKYSHLRHGPVFKKWQEETFKFLINFLKKEAVREKLDFLRISPLIDLDHNLIFKKTGFRPSPMHNMDAEITFLVDLNQDLDKILAKMRKSTRYLIRKAEKTENLIIKRGTTQKLLEDFLVLFRKTAKLKNFVSERGIEREFNIFSKENKADIFIAYCQEKPVAGALIVYWGDQGIYRYSGTSESGFQVNASYKILWEAIKEAKVRNLPFFNLWGGLTEEIEDKTHPWYGLDLFKRGFGGEKKAYPHAQDLPVSLAYWRTFLIESIIKYLRGYDKVLFWRLPPFFRRLFKV